MSIADTPSPHFYYHRNIFQAICGGGGGGGDGGGSIAPGLEEDDKKASSSHLSHMSAAMEDHSTGNMAIAISNNKAFPNNKAISNNKAVSSNTAVPSDTAVSTTLSQGGTLALALAGRPPVNRADSVHIVIEKSAGASWKEDNVCGGGAGGGRYDDKGDGGVQGNPAFAIHGTLSSSSSGSHGSSSKSAKSVLSMSVGSDEGLSPCHAYLNPSRLISSCSNPNLTVTYLYPILILS